MTRQNSSRPDPRRPLVIDTHELGRRPGSMNHVRRTVPAPAFLGNPVGEVRAGSDIELDLRLESVVDGVLVSGTAIAVLSGECGRCLDPIDQDVEVELQELFAYPDVEAEKDAPRLVDELLDLEPLLRDVIVTELPVTPLCSDDCAGLCPDCGARWDDLPADHLHQQEDLRWAALQGLRLDQKSAGGEPHGDEPGGRQVDAPAPSRGRGEEL